MGFHSNILYWRADSCGILEQSPWWLAEKKDGKGRKAREVRDERNEGKVREKQNEGQERQGVWEKEGKVTMKEME